MTLRANFFSGFTKWSREHQRHKKCKDLIKPWVINLTVRPLIERICIRCRPLIQDLRYFRLFKNNKLSKEVLLWTKSYMWAHSAPRVTAYLKIVGMNDLKYNLPCTVPWRASKALCRSIHLEPREIKSGPQKSNLCPFLTYFLSTASIWRRNKNLV